MYFENKKNIKDFELLKQITNYEIFKAENSKETSYIKIDDGNLYTVYFDLVEYLDCEDYHSFYLLDRKKNITGLIQIQKYQVPDIGDLIKVKHSLIAHNVEGKVTKVTDEGFWIEYFDGVHEDLVNGFINFTDDYEIW